jgi:hypothetical protein
MIGKRKRHRSDALKIAWLLLGVCCASSLASAAEWSAASTLIQSHGRLAIGRQVHVVGHNGGDLVHRTSTDGGASWSAASTIASASDNYPMMYGGFVGVGDTLYLLTAAGDMGGGPKHLDFRKSEDNGASWTSRVRITGAGEEIFRARIVVSGSYVHVGGQGAPTPQGSMWYFRSVDGGASWENGRKLAENLGGYGGGQTIAVDQKVVHLAYTSATNGVGGGPTYYLRSGDHGSTWSPPVAIGEESAESPRQARVQLVAADGHVFAAWQREGLFTGAELPPDRLGYNRSEDGGLTWGVAQILPGDAGINRNHQAIWMTSGGGVHICWRHGNTTSDPTGYMFSPDYGQTWSKRQLALDTNEVNHPYTVVADEKTVHVLAGPQGAMKYAYGRLPNVIITHAVMVGDQVDLRWQSNQTGGVYTVQARADLSAEWSAVAPTNQWPKADTVWTNSVHFGKREYFRIRAEEK